VRKQGEILFLTNNFEINRSTSILSAKDIKRLSGDKWYHATLLSYWDEICEKGILTTYNKDTSNSLDFGYGFYLALTAIQAEKFIAQQLKFASVNENDRPLILEFSFCPFQFFESIQYSTRILGSYDDEFATFVFKNRTQNIAGTQQHEYDLMFGVMSDALPLLLISEYSKGFKSEKEVLESLKKQTSMKQLSLHNQSICDTMHLTKAYTFSIEDCNRKETLDVEQYNRKKSN
jgi:hypothetical protein